MKALKKITSVLISLLLIFTFALPAFADEAAKTTITVNGAVESATYSAYRLLDATSSDKTDGTEGLNISYTLNSTYTTVLQTVTGKTTESDILDYISNLDANGVRSFADAVYAQIKSKTPDATTAGVASGTDVTATFANLEQGYYLISETLPAGAAGQAASLVMLETAGKNAVTVNTKKEVPQFEKKIQETNDTTGAVSPWQDGADYDIGDAVPFQLTATVAKDIANYSTYKLVFHDFASEGLTFLPDTVKVFVKNSTADAVEVTDKTLYKVEVNSTGATGFDAGETFRVVIANAKNLPGVTAGSKIIVEYNATLNEKAKIGAAGNPNEAYLEYSNNAYDNTETGKTPNDKVIAFTFTAVANKVDKNNRPLKGAGFTLYKKVNGNYAPVGSEVKGDELTTFTFKGLDSGEYKLVETTVPAGYKKAEDIEFKIEATYDTDSADPKLTELKTNSEAFGADKDKGTVTTTVINDTGTLLPGTGGIGTTIFYIVGGLMMAVAAVLLITKKRMNSDK